MKICSAHERLVQSARIIVKPLFLCVQFVRMSCAKCVFVHQEDQSRLAQKVTNKRQHHVLYGGASRRIRTLENRARVKFAVEQEKTIPT